MVSAFSLHEHDMTIILVFEKVQITTFLMG